MTAISWTSGINGAWTDATRWSPGQVPISFDDVTVSEAGNYTISLSGSQAANTLTFDAPGASLSELGDLSVTGAFDMEAGTVLLRGVNAFGSVAISGGALRLDNVNALGGANLNVTGGELTAWANLSLTNSLSMGGASIVTIDALTGDTLDLANGAWVLAGASAPTIQFGSTSRRGTVVWNSVGGANILNPGTYAVDVAGGTLRGDGNGLGYLLANGATTTVAAGATIDLAGAYTPVDYLQGGGEIIDSAVNGTLIPASLVLINGGDFSGVISGAIAVEVAALTTFTGANTYTGGTGIDAGHQLILAGNGGVTGGVDDQGFLIDEDTSGAFTPGVISGPGVLDMYGTGVLVLNSANSFTGGANILAGTVQVGNAAGLGAGAVFVDSAEIIGTAIETFGEAITLRSSVTLAASTGATLTLGGPSSSLDLITTGGPFTLTIGDSAHRGVVVLAPSSLTIDETKATHVEVAYGTLRAGIEYDLSFATDFTVLAGATLDAGGFNLMTPNLSCAGTIPNSAPTAANLETSGASSVSGVIKGDLYVQVFSGKLTLSGANNYSRGTEITASGTLQRGAGGATGSIGGAIADDGALEIDETGAVALSGLISGAGALTQAGNGATTLRAANTYTGGTTVEKGELIVANATGLGQGLVDLKSGSRLIADVNLTLPSTLTIDSGATLAAKSGFTLATSASQPWTVNAFSGFLTFGSSTATGTVVWNTPAGYAFGGVGSFAVNIAAGTLQAGDDSFFVLTDADINHAVTSTTIGANGTLDAAGHGLAITNLRGSGVIEDTGAATTLNFGGGAFSGKIDGDLTPYLSGIVTLTGGLGTFTASLTIYSGSRLTLSGASAHNYTLANNTTAVTIVTLAAGASETGTLHGFVTSDKLDLAGVLFASASKSFAFNAIASSGGKLIVTDGTHSETVTLAGDYTGATFTLSSDGHGGTDVTVAGAVAAVRQVSPASSPQALVSAMAGLAGPSGLGLSPSRTPIRGGEVALLYARA